MKDKHWTMLYVGVSLLALIGKVWLIIRRNPIPKDRPITQDEKIRRGYNIISELSKTNSIPSARALGISMGMAEEAHDLTIRSICKSIRFHEERTGSLGKALGLAAHEQWEISVSHQVALCKIVQSANEIDRRT